ncbi:MAG: TGS domain-containing protein, partial [Acidobacteriota bacterium]
RTEQMHHVAEEGIAAHWLYKEGRSSKSSDEHQFQWLRQIVDWQREIPDAREFLSSLKLDLYPGEVYVFTPKGEVKVFPVGATPIDFAYAVHTEVGNHCTGAKINGALVPLRTPLKNGDIVEIITSTDGRPRRDWMRLVKTSRARSKIRAHINRRERERSIEVGRRLCDKEMRKYGLNLKKAIASGEIEEIASHFGVAKGDDVLAGMGYGKISPKQVVARLLPPEQLQEIAPQPRKGLIPETVQTVRRVLGWGDEPVVNVEGMDDILVSRARCCDPIPGEPIIGYVTRGKGVSVHAADCANVEQLMMNPERQIPVAWRAAKGSTQPVKLQVEVEDRRGLLAEITSRISDAETNIRHLDSRVEGGRGRITIIVDVADMTHLQRIKQVVSKIPGVTRIIRKGAR